jgi:hypothetical protein
MKFFTVPLNPSFRGVASVHETSPVISGRYSLIRSRSERGSQPFPVYLPGRDISGTWTRAPHCSPKPVDDLMVRSALLLQVSKNVRALIQENRICRASRRIIRIGTDDSEYGHLKEVSARRIIHRKKAMLRRFVAPNPVQMAVSLFLVIHERYSLPESIPSSGFHPQFHPNPSRDDPPAASLFSGNLPCTTNGLGRPAD